MRGDIFNRESHHVRLFKSANSAGNLKIVVLESITARTCQGPKTVVTAEGVAECVRTIDEFNNFKLLRYKSIRE